MVVAANPSPYFAALGLVIVSGVGCAVLAVAGGSFLALVLFLIYMGGMLVVFAYSAALAADSHPESVVSDPVAGNMAVFGLVVGGLCAGVCGGWYEGSWVAVSEMGWGGAAQADITGVALMNSPGGGLLVLGAGALLLALFVVLELTRGLSRGALRAV